MQSNNGSRVLSFLFTLVVLAIIALAARDALTQDPAIQAQARDVACAAPASSAPAPAAGKAGKPGIRPEPAACALQMTRWESRVLGHTLDFESGAVRRRVVCSRHYLVLGDHECRLSM